MKNENQTLQIEITIAPAKGRKGGQHRSPAVPRVPDPPRIPRITRLIALAIKFQDMVDRREVRDYADLARLGYVSRARITQIMNLLNLAPDIQEQILFLGDGSGEQHSQIREPTVRPLTQLVEWDAQRMQFIRLTR